MSDTDRTWPEPLDVPEHVVARLRAAADDELERACDTGGKWNDQIRARVLDAARVVEAFDVLGLPPSQIAALAIRAITLEFEGAVPREDDLIAFVVRSRICRELIELRDAAAARAESHERPDAS